MTKVSIIISVLFFLINNTLSASNLFPADDSTKNNTNPVRIYNTVRLTTDKPVIDGKLDDDCWKTGEWSGDFTQWIPNEGAKPSYPTELKILYDDYNVYVAIRAYDKEPDKIIRKLSRRDEVIGDAVGIDFDSYHDHRTGFEFCVSASGQKADLILTNPINSNKTWNAEYNWNAVWFAKTGMEDSAWVAEFEIPLSQLRYSSDDEQVWGLHAWRWIDHLQEESDWEPQTFQSPGMLYLFGELHGIKGLPNSHRIEIMPYSLGRLNSFQAEPLNPYANSGRSWLGNFGIDAKIGILSNFTADITINPDFGQVESDPSDMNLSAFETFYQEKRPFFLEGKNIFSFDLDNVNLIYSRRIGQAPVYKPDLKENEYLDFPDNTTILSAVKLSGKTSGGLAVGVLQSLTANEKAGLSFEGKEQKINVEPLTNYAVLRLQQDYEKGNTVFGGILTSTNRFIKDTQLEFMNRNAYTGGLDFLHHWNDKEFYVEAKLVGSLINGDSKAMQNLQNSSARYYNRPNAHYLHYDSSRTSLSGYGGKIIVGKKSKGNWRYTTELNFRSPGLELNDIGYMQTADIIKQGNSISYAVYQPESIFRTYNIGLIEYNNWDFGGNYLSSVVDLKLYMEFLNNWAVSALFCYQTPSLDNSLLRGGSAVKMPATWYSIIYARTDPSEKMFFEVNAQFPLANEKSNRSYFVEPGIYFTPSNALKLYLSVFYNYYDDKLMYTNTAEVNNSNKYLLSKINQHTLAATFRIDYNITPEFSIQYYGSPFASVGRYSEFKEVADPKAADYNGRFKMIKPVLNGNEYGVYNNKNGIADYSFENPDFNFSQFRSNLVIRWEYRPGSQVYFVWSHERTGYASPGNNSVNAAMSSLKDIYPDNIFLVKFNYWFTL